MKAIITIGMPCSGKSTWAEDFVKDNDDWVEINRDNIRISLFNLDRYDDYKFSKANEKEVSNFALMRIEQAVKRKKNIICSDTNLNNKYRLALIDNLESLGFDVEKRFFDVEFFDALKRNDKRKDKTIPRSVMVDMYNRALEYKIQNGLWSKHENDESKEIAYIVDIDGTIAYNDGHRGWFEWDKVGNDKPVKGVIDTIAMLWAHGHNIIILSGRDSVCRKETEKWLSDNNIGYDALFMRPAGSMDKDRFVKEKLFRDHIADNYNVLGVFDDRPQVSLLWHDLGLTLFKVGSPIDEF